MNRLSLSVLILTLIVTLTFAAPSETAEQILERHTDKLGPGIQDAVRNTLANEEIDIIIQYDNHIISSHSNIADVVLTVIDNDVKRVELDQDIELLSEWNINRTGAPLAWNYTTGDGVNMAIIDTGILGGDGWNILANNSNVTDITGHGTNLAGIVTQISPDADLTAVKVLEGSSGQLSDLIDGIEWAINNDVDIILLGLEMESYSQIMHDLLEDAYNDGILIIAASGNNDGEIVYPAAYDDVIAVGATDQNDDLASFSNHGYEQELVAPGVNINTTGLGGYELVSGTSIAAPHVAGIAALLWNYNNTLTNEELRGLLQNAAEDLGDVGWDEEYGYGLAQATLTGETSTQNTSYYYEIYNISQYGTENESLTFWLNDTGTYEDVDFTPGYYLITRWIPDPVNHTLYVNENGTIFTLVEWDEGTLTYSDDYSVDGTSSDGAIWVDGKLNVTLNDDTPVSHSALDGECYDSFMGSQGHYDFCWFENTDDRDDCDAESDINLLDCSSHADCNIDDIGNEREQVFVTNTARRVDKTGDYFDFCGGGSPIIYRTEAQQVLIMDAKRSVCVDSATYAYQGRYDGTQWATYYSATCQGLCDSDLTTTTTDKNTVLTPPCIGCAVNGTINVAVDVEGDGADGLHIYLNNEYKGQTNNSGTYPNLSTINVGCNQDLNVSVYCRDNTTLCSTQTTQIDLNGDVDNLYFDCSLKCGTGSDLSLSQQEAWATDNGTAIFTITSKNITRNNIKVNISRQDYTGLIVNSTLTLANVSAGQKTNVSATFSCDGNTPCFGSTDYIHIWIDTDNQVTNEDNTNNYLFRPALKKYRVYLDIHLPNKYESIEGVIEEYISTFIDITENTSEENIFGIVIRQRNPLYKKIKGPNGEITLPWGSRLYSATDANTNKTAIFIEGVQIEGVIAGTKRLINARNYLLSDTSASTNTYIDNYDTFGISIYDQMHTPEAETHFEQPLTTQFSTLVENILFDNNFEVSIRPVKTTSNTSYGEETILRIKNVNSDYSDNYKEVIGVSDTPIVFAGGAGSSIETWEYRCAKRSLSQNCVSNVQDGLSKQMAQEGWDVWEIEVTGGPNNDCENCPNYIFTDVVEQYWPTSIAAITQYTGKNQINYIAHSNGCYIGLNALDQYSISGKDNAGYYFDYNTGSYSIVDLPTNVVGKFVGVACPVNLNHWTIFTGGTRLNGNDAIDQLNESGKSHVTLSDYAKRIAPLGEYIGEYLVPGGGRISLNLMNHYNHLAINTTSDTLGSNINVSAIYLHYGISTPLLGDTLVSSKEADDLLDAINISNETSKIWWFTSHNGLINSVDVFESIKENIR